MRFLVDAQLPPALARLLEAHGHEAKHVEDEGLRGADDRGIWDHAMRHQFVIVTKDEDFAHRLSQAKTAPVIVWLRVGNTTSRALLQGFEPLIGQITDLIGKGERLIEVR
jgi:predicted nuclease of predicted toxin-antitoxin system